jgi:hypothetical protein
MVSVSLERFSCGWPRQTVPFPKSPSAFVVTPTPWQHANRVDIVVRWSKIPPMDGGEVCDGNDRISAIY